MAETLIGGQALLEGVMMRGPKRIGIAVRTPEGTIKTESFGFSSILVRKPYLNIPFVRGSIAVVEMLIIGMKSLGISAKHALPDEEGNDDSGSWWFWVSAAFSVVLALLLFKAAPLGVAELLSKVIPLDGVAYGMVEGVAKASIFILYIVLISLMPDIMRVWQYHGAEHKVVRCFEAKKTLTVAHARSCSRLHPRCGTSFVIFIIFLSIFVYVWIPVTWGFGLKLAARLILLPVLFGVSYEILRLAGKFPESLVFKAISAPGMATQLLTTREPDDAQLAVAIRALKVSLK